MSTQQEIADAVGLPQRTVADSIGAFSENGNLAESDEITPAQR